MLTGNPIEIALVIFLVTVALTVIASLATAKLTRNEAAAEDLNALYEGNATAFSRNAANDQFRNVA